MSGWIIDTHVSIHSCPLAAKYWSAKYTIGKDKAKWVNCKYDQVIFNNFMVSNNKMTGKVITIYEEEIVFLVTIQKLRVEIYHL